MCDHSKEDLIENAFKVLSRESRELYIPKSVGEVSGSISALEFYRDYVSKNVPVVLRGGVKGWKAVEKWSVDYLRERIGEKLVCVAVTPDGYADAVAQGRDGSGTRTEKEYFVMPEERYITMNEFLDGLEKPRADSVFYIQKQNSNFEEFSELWRDIDSSDLSWATEAFPTKPDAINFWMGDERAVTSMHKDPYENIYCVIDGEKEFTLHPPTDLPWIPYENYPCAVYKEIEAGKWITEPSVSASGNPVASGHDDDHDDDHDDSVPWIAVDPLKPDYEKYPRYGNAVKLKVRVCKGDVFYLPSLWFHHVKQSHGCVAINYWYDMEYDIKYAYYKSLETLCK